MEFMPKTFLDKLAAEWREGKFICVGLDSDFSKIPPNFKNQFEFNKSIIDQTAEFVCAYKINSAFYEAEGVDGWRNLKETISYIHQNYPDIPVILDAKRGDIENTNESYAKACFDDLAADAVTVSPYLGKESLKPFLDRSDKGIFVLVKTSNPGAGEFQDLNVYTERSRGMDGKPLYQVIAQHITEWNVNGNLGVVVGAPFEEELATVREIIGDLPILIPGIGVQGGNLENTIKSGLNKAGNGILIHSARGIIFAIDPNKAAGDLHKKIQNILKNV